MIPVFLYPCMYSCIAPPRRYLVSQHPDVEAKIAAELDSLGLLAKPGAPPPRPAEWGDLQKLTYLGCAIKARSF